jgi:uncharacterized membrane protein
MRGDESPGPVAGYRTTRTEAFSDGVFAIAITVLVLEIGVPAGAEDDLLGALADQWPSYLAYVVSFATIGEVEPARVAATVYGINLLLTALLVSALWRYAVHTGLVRTDLKGEDVETLTRRLTPGLAGYVVMIALGLFLPVIAVIGYFAIAVFILVPFHVLRRHASPRPRGVAR